MRKIYYLLFFSIIFVVGLSTAFIIKPAKILEIKNQLDKKFYEKSLPKNNYIDSQLPNYRAKIRNSNLLEKYLNEYNFYKKGGVYDPTENNFITATHIIIHLTNKTYKFYPVYDGQKNIFSSVDVVIYDNGTIELFIGYSSEFLKDKKPAEIEQAYTVKILETLLYLTNQNEKKTLATKRNILYNQILKENVNLVSIEEINK